MDYIPQHCFPVVVMKHLPSCNLPPRNQKCCFGKKGHFSVLRFTTPAGVHQFARLYLSASLQLLSAMKSKAEDTPLLLLATDEVLLHLHPIMLLLRTDAVAMTTETISVKKRKKKTLVEQLAVCNRANSCCQRSCFTAVSLLFTLKYLIVSV